MVYNKYKIEDIEIGGEAYFDDVYSGKILVQSNFDEYWTVYRKEGSIVYLSFKEEARYAVDVKEIRQYIGPA